MTRKMNKLLEQYKNPLITGGYYQFVAPQGYSFYYNGECQGRIIWTSSPENYYIKKDE